MSPRSKLIGAELRRRQWRVVQASELGFVALSQLFGITNEDVARSAFSSVRGRLADLVSDEASPIDSLLAVVGSRLASIREERKNLETVEKMGRRT